MSQTRLRPKEYWFRLGQEHGRRELLDQLGELLNIDERIKAAIERHELNSHER